MKVEIVYFCFSCVYYFHYYLYVWSYEKYGKTIQSYRDSDVVKFYTISLQNMSLNFGKNANIVLLRKNMQKVYLSGFQSRNNFLEVLLFMQKWFFGLTLVNFAR